ncbi:hypothetical protein EF918_30460 [Streptomyces sp. WAC06614]|nr:hypothetical protein EF918_30460 [Streptomyces sp. WAC06614]
MGVWRWRRNPLRRTTDLIEAWVAFAALVSLLVLAPAAGCLAGLRVDATLQRAAQQQQQERQLVPAVVVRPAAGPPADAPQDPAAQHQGPRRSEVVAAWTAPDGSTHQGTVPAAQEPPRPGDRFRIWTDTAGRPVTRPLEPRTASVHAAVAGLATALGTAALTVTVRRLVVRRLTHERYRRLDRAWAAVGPDWGRTGADS